MSDRDLSFLSTRAIENSGWLTDPDLRWQCSGNTIDVALEADELLELAGPMPVRWRFDRAPASERESWFISTLGQSAEAPETTIFPFTENAKSAASVLVRVTDPSGRTHDFRFSLVGLTRGLGRLGCVGHLEVLGERHASRGARSGEVGEGWDSLEPARPGNEAFQPGRIDGGR